MARYYSNTSKNMTLTSGIGTSDTSITVNDASGLPVSFPYLLAIDPDTASIEIVRVDSAASNTLTVVRGQQDTPAKVHSTGAAVIHAWTALDGQEAQDHMAATQNVHGVGASASVVGTTTSQTLTNKTMSGASNTFSAIPGSALTGSISTATIPVANVSGDWPIDTRSTGNIPVDTRTTGNLPGSRLASPVTSAMTFSGNATVNQTNSGIGLAVVANATPNAEAIRVTAVSTAIGVTVRRNNSTSTGSSLLALQDENGTNLVSASRAGAVTAVGNVEAPDFTIDGSPDRSVKTELNALNSPPRLSASRATGQSISLSTFTPLVFPTVGRNLGTWTINTGTGFFSVPLNGFYQFSFTCDWGSTFVASKVADVYFRKAGVDTRLERADSDPFGNGAITVSYGVELQTSDSCAWVVWQNIHADFIAGGFFSGFYVGPIS